MSIGEYLAVCGSCAAVLDDGAHAAMLAIAAAHKNEKSGDKKASHTVWVGRVDLLDKESAPHVLRYLAEYPN